jgi:hypothetical protein
MGGAQRKSSCFYNAVVLKLSCGFVEVMYLKKQKHRSRFKKKNKGQRIKNRENLVLCKQNFTKKRKIACIRCL